MVNIKNILAAIVLLAITLTAVYAFNREKTIESETISMPVVYPIVGDGGNHWILADEPAAPIHNCGLDSSEPPCTASFDSDDLDTDAQGRSIVLKANATTSLESGPYSE